MDLDLLERFALAENRADALERLIPGTEAHAFFHNLQLQHEQRYEDAREHLEQWTREHGHTTLAEEAKRRLHLLRWEHEPAEAANALSRETQASFHHHREVETPPGTYPTTLPEETLDPERLFEEARRSHSGLGGFRDAALRALVQRMAEQPKRYDARQIGELLDRLEHPDLPQLLDLVLRDLDDEDTGGFGSRDLHAKLLLNQLLTLRQKRPGLETQAGFIHAILRRMRPHLDVDWENDLDARTLYLDTLYDFVTTLPDTWRSLHAHVLYHRLALDHTRGNPDRARLLAYLALPREVRYNPRDHLRELHRSQIARLGERFDGATGLDPIGHDEDLVRELVAHFLNGADDIDAFAPFFERRYLERLWAITNLMSGYGDPSRWLALLDDPSAYQALIDHVEIEFAPSNPATFGATDTVTLDVDLKNIESLVIKVFRIHALNHFLATGQDVDTDLDLDGLVASLETTHTFDLPPLRRHRQRFSFEALSAPGVYVVELIGNGLASRALIRKGRLQIAERKSAAGHVFTVFDANGRQLKDATFWLDSRAIHASEHGHIRLPYTTRPRHITAFVQHGELATTHAFHHSAESYTLHAGIFIDRESLIAGHSAQVALRPRLLLSNVPVPIELLEEPALIIESTDHEGTSATRTLTALSLSDHDLFTATFKVPERLASIAFRLTGRVRNLSRQTHEDLTSNTTTHAVARIRAEPVTDDLHLACNAHGYTLSFLGLSGEPRAGRRIELTLTHRDVTRDIRATLQTDAEGRLHLGTLHRITALSAQRPNGHTTRFSLLQEDRITRPPQLHAHTGEDLHIPLTSTPDNPRSISTLLELRDNNFTRDAMDAASLEPGALVLRNLTPGHYLLVLHDENTQLPIHVAQAQKAGRWLISPTRTLEHNATPPAHLAKARTDDTHLTLQLTHASPHTRVHLAGNRLLPSHPLFDSLAHALPAPRELDVEPLESHYLSGRDIGDEYRYILDRKHARVFPGNMLERPGLLLNPWAIRTTSTLRDEVSTGEAFGGSSKGAKKKRKAGRSRARRAASGPDSGYACLDFLDHPAHLALGLTPDEHGCVTLPLTELAGVAHLRVLITDPSATSCRTVLLDAPHAGSRDLRLLDALDPDEHLSERKQITPLPAQSDLVIEDTRTARLEVYDSLAKVYQLFSALNPVTHLDTFAFITRWHRLSNDEKRTHYSKYACHELHLFLRYKDTDFFNAVVAPYLQYKKHKTFIDAFLLNLPLDPFLTPVARERLNTAERILAAHATQDAPGLRRLLDTHATLPPQIERDNQLFRAALGSGALDEGGGLLPPASPPPPRGGGGAPSAKRAMAASMDAMMAEPEPAFEKEAIFDMDEEEEAEDLSGDDGFLDSSLLRADLDARKTAQPLFRQADTTQAWAETHYYRRRLADTHPGLVPINDFWRDFALHGSATPFLSPALAQATSSFTEMIFALALLDLPFEAQPPATRLEGSRMTITANTPAVVFHQEIKPAAQAQERTPILVSQNYFRADDRYTYEGNEQVDKYVSGAFLMHTIYLTQVVLTNPTSSRQKLELLLQIPRGAMPIGADSFVTRGLPVQLGAYATKTFEYAFYFPEPGTFPHYPAHVSRNEALLVAAPPQRLEVLAQPRERDEQSWPWISQHATHEQLLTYLGEANLARIDLARIGWRMREPEHFRDILELLRQRHAFHNELWAYALKHHDTQATREYLESQHTFLSRSGPEIHTPLLTTRAEARNVYEHIEYAPLFNARAHRVGHSRRILNTDLANQYQSFLHLLCHRPTLTPDDALAATYYLLLLDRVEDAIALFARIDASAVTAKLQYDYMRAYLAFFTDEPEAARPAIEPWLEHPVDRWRKRFAAVAAMLDEARPEASHATPAVVDEDNREQRQAELAASEPSLTLSVESGEIVLETHHIERLELRFYRMDIELLFSREPFVQQQSERFSWIQPNHTEPIELNLNTSTHRIPLPEALRHDHVVIEAVGGGRRASVIHYAGALDVQLSAAYGQLRVRHRETRAPLSRVYVKAYAQTHSGEVRFYKDGYTDLRGAFDYVSLSTRELDDVSRLALLVMSAEHGAVITETGPP